MLKILSSLVSVLFHPLFFIGYLLIFLLHFNPYLFGFSGEKAEGLLVISVFITAVFFPLLSIVLMKMLGLVNSLELVDKKERIGPLIATGIFYLWLFINIRKNDMIPPPFTIFVLGSTIGVFMALMFNSFVKISLHTISAGGFLVAMMMIIFYWSYGPLHISIFDFNMIISERLLLMVTLIVIGLVGSSRLILKAHKTDEIYQGYFVGILSQLVAIFFLF